VLELQQLHGWYGKAHVLDGVDLRVAPGEVVSLLGRNGAGRSTTVRAVMGHVKASGSVRLAGRELMGLAPHHVARAGIAYVPESRDIFPRLTVRQNLLLGERRRAPGAPGGRAGRPWAIDDFERLFPILRERANSPAGVLSGGEQQLLALSRALMGQPQVLLVDEPTEGLAPRMVEQVADLLTDVARRGTAVLMVEQKLDIALQLSRRAYLMGQGRVVFEGDPKALLTDAALCSEWLSV